MCITWVQTPWAALSCSETLNTLLHQEVLNRESVGEGKGKSYVQTFQSSLCVEFIHERSSPNGTKTSFICSRSILLNISNLRFLFGTHVRTVMINAVKFLMADTLGSYGFGEYILYFLCAFTILSIPWQIS